MVLLDINTEYDPSIKYVSMAITARRAEAENGIYLCNSLCPGIISGIKGGIKGGDPGFSAKCVEGVCRDVQMLWEIKRFLRVNQSSCIRTSTIIYERFTKWASKVHERLIK